ncbi:hypothetical protein METP2_01163 [Methanosarcinales archaeon]|nr:hypothetical protein [Candidatus Methanoperedens sp.]CAG0967072.1 hypothetical protein METP2_01163 [Methanosarcinales archaeon]
MSEKQSGSELQLYQKAGIEFLNTLELRPVDMSAIKSYLETLKTLNTQIELMNSQIANKDSEDVKLLMSILGIDYYSAVLIQMDTCAVCSHFCKKQF